MTIESKEPPRGFAVLLQQIDDGSLHAELSETIQRVAGECAQHAENVGGLAKGELTLKIKLAVSANGTVTVQADVASKTPKAARPGSTFFLTKGNNLSVENPRQPRLPLRDVSPAEKPRDVAAEKPATRTI